MGDANDIGPCPICNSEAWRYTEYIMKQGRQCQVCEGEFYHSDLGVPEAEER